MVQSCLHNSVTDCGSNYPVQSGFGSTARHAYFPNFFYMMHIRFCPTFKKLDVQSLCIVLNIISYSINIPWNILWFSFPRPFLLCNFCFFLLYFIFLPFDLYSFMYKYLLCIIAHSFKKKSRSFPSISSHIVFCPTYIAIPRENASEKFCILKTTFSQKTTVFFSSHVRLFIICQD